MFLGMDHTKIVLKEICMCSSLRISVADLWIKAFDTGRIFVYFLSVRKQKWFKNILGEFTEIKDNYINKSKSLECNQDIIHKISLISQTNCKRVEKVENQVKGK